MLWQTEANRGRQKEAGRQEPGGVQADRGRRAGRDREAGRQRQGGVQAETGRCTGRDRGRQADRQRLTEITSNQEKIRIPEV